MVRSAACINSSMKKRRPRLSLTITGPGPAFRCHDYMIQLIGRVYNFYQRFEPKPPKTGIQYVLPFSTTVLNSTLMVFGVFIIVIPPSQKFWIILRTLIYILLTISSAIMNTWTAVIRASLRKSFLNLPTAVNEIPKLQSSLHTNLVSFRSFIPFLFWQRLCRGQ